MDMYLMIFLFMYCMVSEHVEIQFTNTHFFMRPFLFNLEHTDECALPGPQRLSRWCLVQFTVLLGRMCVWRIQLKGRSTSEEVYGNPGDGERRVVCPLALAIWGVWYLVSTLKDIHI